MILPGSQTPSDKYLLKNLTFVVRISTRVATSPFQLNSLRGQGEDQQLKSQEGHCFFGLEKSSGVPKVTKMPTFSTSTSTVLKCDTAENKRFQAECLHCSGPHYVYRCKQFRALSFSEKCKQIKRLGLRRLCLNPGHIALKCASGLKCRKANCESITHNTILHLPDASGRSQKPVDGKDAASSILAKNDNTKSDVKVKSLAAYSNIQD